MADHRNFDIHHQFVSSIRHPCRYKSKQSRSDDITSTAKSIAHNFIVAFRASLRKMTNFKVDIVSDTVCRKSL